MKVKQDSLTLIIAGKWNRHILTVEWLSKNIFETDSIQVEFSLNLGLPPRFMKDDIRIIPTEERITFVALKYSENVFSRIEQMAFRIAELLPVTPMSAFGTNFGFIEESPSDDLLSLYKLSDNDALSDNSIQIENYSIKRKLLVEDQILNFSINSESGSMVFNFNFHYQLQNQNSKELKEKVKGRYTKNKLIAEQLMHNVYKLVLDDEEEEHE